VIYVNLDSLPSRITRLKGRVPLLWKLRRKSARERPATGERPQLYFSAHPLRWWGQFDDACEVELRPWDVMGNAQEEELLINDRMATLGYRLCAWFEARYPARAARWWSYPLIVLTKRSAPTRH
jgi:hypothetical protein